MSLCGNELQINACIYFNTLNINIKNKKKDDMSVNTSELAMYIEETNNKILFMKSLFEQLTESPFYDSVNKSRYQVFDTGRYCIETPNYNRRNYIYSRQIEEEI